MLKCMSDAIISTNLERGGGRSGRYFGTAMLSECVGVCLLIPAHEYEMRDPLVYLLIVKY